MIRILSSLFFLGVVCAAGLAQARVFNFSGEKFAPYVRGLYEPTTTGDQAFANSSGAGNTFSDKNTVYSSLEFGFAYKVKDVRFRFGFEALKPAALKGVTGSSAAGTELYTLDNDILGYAPKIGFELNIREWSSSRIYIAGDYGAMSVTIKNTYALTAAGQSAYPGMVDFTEELKGSGQALDGALGFETLMFDTTTLALEVGYRTLSIANLKHNKNYTSFQGSVSKGAAARNDDGTDRALSLNNLYVAAAFRFWIF